MERSRTTPLRLLAPVALIVFAIALALILSSGGGGGGGTSSNAAQKASDLRSTSTTTTATRHSRHSSTRTGSATRSRSVYVVKQGDTLAGIAQTTGVPVEMLMQLNTGLDQFGLRAGQRIKLR